jgi:hypothetical protein
LLVPPAANSPEARSRPHRRGEGPAYSSLLDIIRAHDFDKVFTLVEVTGNHLGAIVHAISFGNCERIHEYHRKLYDPPEPNEPIIESITITSAIAASDALRPTGSRSSGWTLTV